MKIDAIGIEAKKWLLAQLNAAGGLADLVQCQNLGTVFYFADRPVIDGDFESGLGMKPSMCDKELESFARDQNLLGVFQNNWSKIGDLDLVDAEAAGTFAYRGQYYHFSEKPGLLSIINFRRVSVTQFGVIFLVGLSPAFKALPSTKTEAKVLSDVDANVIACATRFVFVTAFDAESWLGAALGDPIIKVT